MSTEPGWTPPSHCFGIVGWKNSGKTTMTAQLVTELTGLGFRVATIKHAHHAFQIDDGNTDSAKHRRAGATQVGIVSAGRWALITERADGAPDDAHGGLRAMIERLAPADVVLIEGFKMAPHRKLEVRRAAALEAGPLGERAVNIVAVAADHRVEESPLPTFALDDTPAIARFIAARLNLGGLGMGGRP